MIQNASAVFSSCDIRMQTAFGDRQQHIDAVASFNLLETFYANRERGRRRIAALWNVPGNKANHHACFWVTHSIGNCFASVALVTPDKLNASINYHLRFETSSVSKAFEYLFCLSLNSTDEYGSRQPNRFQ